MITARFAGKCVRCQGRIERGDLIDYYAPGEIAHAACPPREHRPPKPGPPDAEDYFEAARCQHCGAFWAARRDQGGLPASCPQPANTMPRQIKPLAGNVCGGPWGDNEPA
jgi:hypothetical protein